MHKFNSFNKSIIMASAIFFLFFQITTHATLIGNYNVTFNEVTYDQVNNTSTWTYTVSGTGVNPALSHWVLALCDNHNVLWSNYAYTRGYDPTTGVEGIKWDISVQPNETKTFSFKLNGLYGQIDVDVAAVKAGTTVNTGLVTGPSCDVVCTNSIGDFVWHDKDVDGVQDSNEPGIQGVVVQLLQSNAVIATTTTDANGFYQFTGLANGTYTVKLADANFTTGGVLSSSNELKWYATKKNQGSDDTKDSDGDVSTHTVDVTLNCQNNPTIDFGFYKSCISLQKTGPQTIQTGGTITYTFTVENCGDLKLSGGAQVYDAMINPSGDHQIASKSPVLPGEVWTFTKTYTPATGTCGELTNTASAIGHPVLPNGTYLPDVQTTDTWIVDVLCEPCTNTIGDYVWHDKDVDGIQDTNEPGIESVVVQLIQSNAVVATTTTDANGLYQFTGLANGTYVVKLADANFTTGGVLASSDQLKWYATSKDQGSDDTKDSDGNESTHTVDVTVNC
ncbi:MAG: SdrD B-like domain-containing protein, partial [bacterium]